MRSIAARIASLYIRFTNVSDKTFLKEFNKIKEQGEQHWDMDPKLISDDIEEVGFDGLRVYFVNSNTKYDKILFYIHGGYYMHEAVSFHLKMLKKIIEKTNAMLVFPVYPVVPFYNVDDSFAKMKDLIEKLKLENTDKKFVISGDSAGGGYALALAEELKEQPDELILLSPWIDITMQNPDIPKFDKVDPMISVEKAKYIGNLWKNGHNSTDAIVSPLYGNVENLKNVTTFVGTREVFYPDILLLQQKLGKSGINATLIVGEKMGHVYPAYPVPEGRKALGQIVDIINK